MAYSLEPGEPVAPSVRRVAREQADAALDSLRTAARDRARADDAIHDARKRFKKIRAVLRLVRPELGEVYGAENRAFRDTGRLLAPVRESAVAPKTLEAVLGENDDRPELGRRLRARHRQALDEALADGGPLARATTMAVAARDRIDGWPLEDAHGFGALGPGLGRVYRRGHDRMGGAYRDPTGPHFHEWRKRAKYLWYHLRILTPLWPDVLDPWAEAQHALCDLLGDANDLHDLLGLLSGPSGPAPDGGDTPELLDAVRQRRGELWERAHPVGRRLYAEDPDAFVRRMGTYWDVHPNGGALGEEPSPERRGTDGTNEGLA